MTKTLSLLIASTALTLGVGLPAWSAMHSAAPQIVGAPASPAVAQGEGGVKLIVVDDDGEGEGKSYRARRSEREDDDDDDECDDDEGSCKGANNPAPAGAVAPPQNGLFGNGQPPQVKVN
mgnify:CR=1 FL=1